MSIRSILRAVGGFARRSGYPWCPAGPQRSLYPEIPDDGPSPVGCAACGYTGYADYAAVPCEACGGRGMIKSVVSELTQRIDRQEAAEKALIELGLWWDNDEKKWHGNDKDIIYKIAQRSPNISGVEIYRRI